MKVLIFTQWAKMCRIIYDHLSAFLKETDVYMVTGDLDKDAIVEQFKESKGNAILVSTDCLSYGKNLQEAEVLIHFDLPWSPNLIEQRCGRIDRIGQQASKLLIFKLLIKDSVEDKVVELLEHKQAMFKSVIEGGGDIETNIIEELFND